MLSYCVPNPIREPKKSVFLKQAVLYAIAIIVYIIHTAKLYDPTKCKKFS